MICIYFFLKLNDISLFSIKLVKVIFCFFFKYFLQFILGTFSFVYLGRFLKRPEEKIALKYVIPTSSPSRTMQEIECLLNIGHVLFYFVSPFIIFLY